MPRLLIHRTPFLVLCSLLAVLLVLAACGDDDDDSDNGDNGTPTPEASGEDATATPEDVEETPEGPTRTPVDTAAPLELREFTIAPQVTRANPGTITFQVTNAGEFPHEFVVIRSDLPIAQLPRLGGEEGVDEDEVEIVGRLDPIEPGTLEELPLDLDLGEYVLICNLTGGGESHYLNGMYEQFTVENLPAQPPVVTPVPLQ